MNTTYLYEGDITFFARLSESIVDIGGYQERDFSSQPVHGWTIAYTPKISALRVDLFQWCEFQKNLRTGGAVAVGSWEDINLGIERMVNGISNYCPIDPFEQKRIAEQIKSDAKQFTLDESPVYTSLKKLLAVYEHCAPVSLDDLPDSFVMAYVTGKDAIPGTLFVRDVSYVIRPETSKEEVIDKLSDLGISAKFKGNWLEMIYQGKETRTHVDRSKYLTVSLPRSTMRSDHFNMPNFDTKVIDINGGTENYLAIEELVCNENLRMVPQNIARKFLLDMKVLDNFHDRAFNFAHEKIDPVNDTIQEREELRLNQARKTRIEILKGRENVVLEALLNQQLDVSAIKTGMLIGYAHAYPRGGIDVSIGQVSTIKHQFGKFLISVVENYNFDFDLNLKFTWSKLEKPFEGSETVSLSLGETSELCTYENGKLYFKWVEKNGTYLLGMPCELIARQAGNQASTATISVDTPNGSHLETMFFNNIPGAPKGTFKLPKYFSLTQEQFIRIQQLARDAENEFQKVWRR